MVLIRIVKTGKGYLCWWRFGITYMSSQNPYVRQGTLEVPRSPTPLMASNIVSIYNEHKQVWHYPSIRPRSKQKGTRNRFRVSNTSTCI
jgi:hypothetical protein